jgi:DNA (cytosine-5)-methyltransferase 1
MRGDSPPSRETGEGVAGSISARAGRSGGRAGADENDAAGYLQPVVTPAVPRWPAEVAPTLNAHFGEKQGLEDQHALGGAGLFVPAVSHAPTGEGFDASEDGTGRGTPIVPVQMFRCSECGDVFHDPYGEIDTLSPPECGRCGNDENNTLAGDDDGQPPVIGFHGSQDPDVYGPVSGPVGRNQGAETCVAFDTNQITHPANRSNPKPNGPSPDLCRWGQPPAVATQYAVRRLTPRECERLQGFPDDWTLIPWRGKPAEQCPDGPRYKAIGNSKATRVVHWIGCRIQRVRERAERDLLASILQ